MGRDKARPINGPGGVYLSPDQALMVRNFMEQLSPAAMAAMITNGRDRFVADCVKFDAPMTRKDSDVVFDAMKGMLEEFYRTQPAAKIAQHSTLVM